MRASLIERLEYILWIMKTSNPHMCVWKSDIETLEAAIKALRPGVPWPSQILVKREDFTEKDHFVLEAAEQLGFVNTDCDSEFYACSDQSVVTLARRIRSAS